MGDRYEEFGEFVRVRAGSLWRTAYLLTGDRQLAEDLVQSALARTYGRWRRIGDGRHEAYVRRVLYTEYVTWWRRRWLREQPSESPPEQHDDDHSERVAVRVSVRTALAGLSRKQRAVIVLRYFEDRSVEEAADLLGVSTGTVKSQTNYALRRLRGLLDGAQLGRIGERA